MAATEEESNGIRSLTAESKQSEFGTCSDLSLKSFNERAFHSPELRNSTAVSKMCSVSNHVVDGPSFPIYNLGSFNE